MNKDEKNNSIEKNCEDNKTNINNIEYVNDDNNMDITFKYNLPLQEDTIMNHFNINTKQNEQNYEDKSEATKYSEEINFTPKKEQKSFELCKGINDKILYKNINKNKEISNLYNHNSMALKNDIKFNDYFSEKCEIILTDDSKKNTNNTSNDKKNELILNNEIPPFIIDISEEKNNAESSNTNINNDEEIYYIKSKNSPKSNVYNNYQQKKLIYRKKVKEKQSWSFSKNNFEKLGLFHKIKDIIIPGTDDFQHVDINKRIKNSVIFPMTNKSRNNFLGINPLQKSKNKFIFNNQTLTQTNSPLEDKTISLCFQNGKKKKVNNEIWVKKEPIIEKKNQNEKNSKMNNLKIKEKKIKINTCFNRTLPISFRNYDTIKTDINNYVDADNGLEIEKEKKIYSKKKVHKKNNSNCISYNPIEFKNYDKYCGTKECKYYNNPITLIKDKSKYENYFKEIISKVDLTKNYLNNRYCRQKNIGNVTTRNSGNRLLLSCAEENYPLPNLYNRKNAKLPNNKKYNNSNNNTICTDFNSNKIINRSFKDKNENIKGNNLLNLFNLNNNIVKYSILKNNINNKVSNDISLFIENKKDNTKKANQNKKTILKKGKAKNLKNNL